MKLLERIGHDPVVVVLAAPYFVAKLVFIGLLVVMILLSLGCASTDGFVKKDGMNPDGSMTYTLTPEQVAQCAREGGCSTVTNAYEMDLVRQAAKHFCGVDI